MTISPEKKEALFEFGTILGVIIVEAIFAAILYSILALMIGVSVTYLQVFGVLLLINFLSNVIKK
jgi:hypothetical protein